MLDVAGYLRSRYIVQSFNVFMFSLGHLSYLSIVRNQWVGVFFEGLIFQQFIKVVLDTHFFVP